MRVSLILAVFGLTATLTSGRSVPQRRSNVGGANTLDGADLTGADTTDGTSRSGGEFHQEESGTDTVNKLLPDPNTYSRRHRRRSPQVVDSDGSTSAPGIDLPTQFDVPGNDPGELLRELNGIISGTRIKRAESSATDVVDKRDMGDEVVVILEENDPRELRALVMEMGVDPTSVKHWYNNTAFKGFAGTIKKQVTGRLSTFSGVKTYEPKMSFSTTGILVQQVDASWGLSRISKTGAVNRTEGNELDLTFPYNFDDSAGEGVDIYMVDTGIDVNHVDFNGRARFGWAFDNMTIDENGHGTHTAGTAASTTLGVAKKANLIAVKVLGKDGSGNNDDILAGIDWVVRQHEVRRTQKNFRGSVISMSLGSTGVSLALDTAIKSANGKGVHVSVAAGNSGKNACEASPSGASVDSNILAVGAIDIMDRRPGFSNYGSCVTAYAPGVAIISTFIDKKNPATGRTNLINDLSGTSMACPHVSGLIAYYLALYPELVEDPAGMKKLIVSSAEKVEALQGPGMEDDPAIVVRNTGTI